MILAYGSLSKNRTKKTDLTEYPIPTLQARFDLSQKWRGNLRFLPQPEMRPSSIKTNPVESREHL